MARIRWFTRTSRIVALCSFANFINSADRVIMPIAIVPMTKVFGWNMHLQGWILSAFALGYFTSQIIGKQLCFSGISATNVRLYYFRKFLGIEIGSQKRPDIQRFVVEYSDFHYAVSCQQCCCPSCL